MTNPCPDAPELCVRAPDLPVGQVRVAVAQPMVVPGNVAENLVRMEALVAEAAGRGAHLVLFSEAGLTGYDLKGIGIRSAVRADGAVIDQLHHMALRHDVILVVGFFEACDGTLHNTCLALAPDGQRVLQRKHHLTPLELKHGLVPGPATRTIFRINGVRFAIVICADAGIANLYPNLVEQGCDVILAPTAGLGDAGKGYRLDELRDPQRRASYLRDAATVCWSDGAVNVALEFGLGLASCNQMGYVAETGFFHCGHSLIVNTDGRLQAVIPGQFTFEHLQAAVAVGVVSARRRPCSVTPPS